MYNKKIAQIQNKNKNITRMYIIKIAQIQNKKTKTLLECI